ncbi:MAG: site-specific DNA-methyltransferase [Phycisphaerales bacterium]|nr:site-specific DNA-methyltransferase [Phycisphaerales bacterium]
MSAISKIKQKPLLYPSAKIGKATLVQADCFEWLRAAAPESIHGVVTDPPYGVKEFDDDQLEKMVAGKGGIWRLPPSFDGNVRSPLPRFTALDAKDRERLSVFFNDWAQALLPALRPGAHVFIATNGFVAQLVYSALIAGGFEFRGQLIRLVRTMRGGDRPKNAETEFADVCSMPRACFEPWGVFRKAMPPKMTVADCLRTYQTGGLRRYQDGLPFEDVIDSERTPKAEREIAGHPSIKPQSILRLLVHAALPLGEGVVLDPFAGSGSTLAAAEAVGYKSIGIERQPSYFKMAEGAIRKLAQIRLPEIDARVNGPASRLALFGGK